ncbi:radical SAM domain protein [Coprobacillus sp. CAG:826]|nr:radical SAM domain protein [Coprobacillus sp. CAG:826]
METIKRKSLLYKTDVEYGDYTINHVLGCSHGCLYPCYAYNLKRRFGEIQNREEWLRPKIVSNAIEILEHEIPKYRKDIKSVQLSFTTDPFMLGFPEVTELSIKIIKRLNKDGIKVVTLTKGVIPEEVFLTEKYNEFGITLVSLKDEFKEKFEPNASNYEERIASLKRAHEKGYCTWVSIEPYPTPNIIEQDLEKILDKVSFVDYIVFGMWHYNKIISTYKGYKEFYNECAKKVIDFCEKKHIRYHIKKGTIS